ncbi:twin-arginine translocation signal domain-containing protein, partial [Mesorhizobium sp. M1C.F.Ca.ET.189.01.1.1]
MTYASSSRSSIRGVSRRQFLATSMAGGAALALGGGKAFAQTADTLKVGFVSPRTGPL